MKEISEDEDGENRRIIMDQMLQEGFLEEVPLKLRLKEWDWANHKQNQRNGIPETGHSKFRGLAAAKSLCILYACDVSTQKEPRIHLASPFPSWASPYDKAERITRHHLLTYTPLLERSSFQGADTFISLRATSHGPVPRATQNTAKPQDPIQRGRQP